MVSAAHCDKIFPNQTIEKDCVAKTKSNGVFKQGLVFSQKLKLKKIEKITEFRYVMQKS